MGRILGRGKAHHQIKGLRLYRLQSSGVIGGSSSLSLALSGTVSGGVLIAGASGRTLLLLSTSTGLVSVAGTSTDGVLLSSAQSGAVLASGDSSVQIPIVSVADGDVLIAATSNNTVVIIGTGEGGAPVVLGSGGAAINLSGVGGGAVLVSGNGSGVVSKLFESDFSIGGTGTSTTALRDGTRWDATIGGATGMSIVAGHGLAFPTANILRMFSPYPGSAGFHRITKTGLPLLADNASRWYGWYQLVDMGTSQVTDLSTHPIESGQVGGLDWACNVELVSDTEFYISMQAPGEALGGMFWKQRWRCPNLTRGEVYHLELQVKQLPNTTVGVAPTSRKQMEFHARLYHCTLVGATVVETLLYDDDDFTNRDTSNGVGVGTVSMAANTPLLMSTTDGANMSEFRAGNNGITGVYPNLIHIGDQGGFGISDETWVGPYASSGGNKRIVLSGQGSSTVLVSGAGASTLTKTGSAQGFVRINADGTASIILGGNADGQVVSPTGVFGSSNVAIALSPNGSAVVLIGGQGSSPMPLDGDITGYIASEQYGQPLPLTIDFVRYDGNVLFERVDANIVIIPVV